MGTSCCPAYVEAVKKHVPEFFKYVSKARTPMSYTAELAKNTIKDCYTVFIGPCVAKKYEAYHDKFVNYALTYQELSSFILAEKIEITELSESDFDTPEATNYARHFCKSSGVAETVKYYVKQIDPNLEIKIYYIDGLNKKGLRQLKLAAQGKIKANLIEVMSCEGGCVAGPGVNVLPAISLKALDKTLKK